jgi:hypothetical protein
VKVGSLSTHSTLVYSGIAGGIMTSCMLKHYAPFTVLGFSHMFSSSGSCKHSRVIRSNIKTPSPAMASSRYESINIKKKAHSKGRAGKYNHTSPRRIINRGAASDTSWISYLIDSVDTDFYKRIMRNLNELREACIDPDPDNIQCMLTDVHGSDHRRTSTEAFRSMIDAHGEQTSAIPMRISVHVLALVAAGRRQPTSPAPRHPSSTKQAFWVASHLCHNKSCTNDSHLIWEPNWANRQRDGCPSGEACVHVPYKCIRAHRRPVQNVDWTKLM